MKILIVEDEVSLSITLKKLFEQKKISVDICHDGYEGLCYILSDIYDVVILDIMLPTKNGIEILKDVRNNKITTPILLLTAKGEINDKVQGLELGADDYLTKPFEFAELLARVKTISRRKNLDIVDANLSYGDFFLNPETLELKKKDKIVILSLKEKEILEILIVRSKSPTSKNAIIEKVWGYDSDAEDNNVEVYISFIRKKLKYIKSEVTIKAIRNIGYLLEDTNV